MNLRCPHCRNAFEIVNEESQTEVTCPSCKSKVSIDELLSINPALMLTETASERTRMPASGESVAHFEIKQLLGTGGFGSVFSAKDTRLDRDVAIKIPRMEKLTKWQAEAFVHEAQAAAQLRDPNIVTVHEIGRDDETVYIVSELIDGITLQKWQKEHKPTQNEIASIISKIAQSIHKAHDAGVIHRDLKPSNIIVDAEGVPHITDFGLAKREHPEEITITTKGQVIGTPAYMSPEQASGRSQEVDRRTDVYSMGVMLYELVAGQRPFRGESDLLKDEIIAGDPDPIRTFNKSVSPDLEAICLKAMSVRPGDRFRTADELSEDLDRFVYGESTITRPRGVVEKSWDLLVHYRWATSVIVLSMIAIGSFFVAVSRFDNPSKNGVGEKPRLIVEIKSIPPAIIKVIPVDMVQGNIANEKATVLDATTTNAGFVATKLEPGWYVVEARAPRLGIQECWRYVPPTTSQRKIAHVGVELKLKNWNAIGKDRIRWPDINVIDLVKKGTLVELRGVSFAKVIGGSMAVDKDDGPALPVNQIQVEDFYLSQTEVTVGQYIEVMGQLPNQMPNNQNVTEISNYPVTNVTWFEAMEFAERIGARLPTLSEYLFAATNGGKTTFPWGNHPNSFDDWEFLEVTFPKSDVTHSSTTEDGHPIHNLYSSVAEWTADVYIPIDDFSGRKDTWDPEMLDSFRNSRVIVGGEEDVIRGVFDPANFTRRPRWFAGKTISNPSEGGLGFRVARSVQ